MSAGKGDRPRNCFSKKFKNNYDNIIWKQNKKKPEKQKNNKNTFIYR
jgi:hypothetical protein